MKHATLVLTTGHADFLPASTGDRRWSILSMPRFHVRVPGHGSYTESYPNAHAAQRDAQRRYPDAHPATVIHARGHA